RGRVRDDVSGLVARDRQPGVATAVRADTRVEPHVPAKHVAGGERTADVGEVVAPQRIVKLASEAQPDLGSRRRKHAERRVTDETLVARSVDVLLVEAPAPAAEHVEHHPATELSDVATEQPM